MNCVSCIICMYDLGLFLFSPSVFLSSRVTEACPVTTDLIMRVNVRTTTTKATTHHCITSNLKPRRRNSRPFYSVKYPYAKFFANISA